MDWETAEKDDLSRDRGVLTKADREYLTGQSDIETGSHGERRARERIRNRTKNALMDFGLMFEHLEDRDIEQIFMPENNAQSANQAEMLALAFFLDGIGIQAHMGPGKMNTSTTKRIFETAVERVGKKRGYLVNDADFEIDADKIPHKSLFRDLEEGKELSTDALRFLLETDEVDTEKVQETIRQMVVDENSD
jgi:hypothetical protein